MHPMFAWGALGRRAATQAARRSARLPEREEWTLHQLVGDWLFEPPEIALPSGSHVSCSCQGKSPISSRGQQTTERGE